MIDENPTVPAELSDDELEAVVGGIQSGQGKTTNSNKFANTKVSGGNGGGWNPGRDISTAGRRAGDALGGLGRRLGL